MWADNEANLDLLGFDFLVDGLVIALTEPRLLPLTIGVLGDWGSGKSSLMRIAAAEIVADGMPAEESGGENSPETHSRYITVDFSPWQYEDYEDVKISLMNVVLDALEERLPNAPEELSRLRAFVNGLKRLSRVVGRAGASAAPAIAPILIQGAFPDADSTVLDIATAATAAASQQIGEALVDPGTTSSPNERLPITDIKTFRKEFAGVIESLPDTDAVVVFIDDLDRCLPGTIVDTFEAIRLFLNTPKTAYVLALNQLVVESAIDARYPDLKREDGAGIGRDYLEKMLQLKIAIPPLSAPEAETYVNLLFAELRLPSASFSRIIDRTEEIRASNSLSVAFNVGIAGEVLGDVPAELAADLRWAADITPALSASLRGNPRQLKRFLNNLLLKHRSAARRNIDLELPVLAKLMILEDQHNADFQRVFDWQMATQGSSIELEAAEAIVRSGTDEATLSVISHAVINEFEKATQPTSGRPKERTQIPAAVPSDVEAWARKTHIADWLRLEPAIGKIDLRTYFTYSRDKLSFGVFASQLPTHLQQLLSSVQSEVEANRRSHYAAVKDLDPAERSILLDALLDRVKRNPSGTAMLAALEIAGNNPDVVEQVCQNIQKIPPTSIPRAAGSAAVRRLPSADAATASLLDYWEASGHPALKSLVASARAAQLKAGK